MTYTKLFLSFEAVFHETTDAIRLHVQHSHLKPETSGNSENSQTQPVATNAEILDLLKELTLGCFEKDGRHLFLQHCSRAFLGVRQEKFHFNLHWYSSAIKILDNLNDLKKVKFANILIQYLPKHILPEVDRCLQSTADASEPHILVPSGSILSTEGVEAITQESLSQEDLLPFNIPRGLYSRLLNYQKEALAFATQTCDGRVYIADDMGLGKTLESICVALHYSSHWPMLIITPSSLKQQWKNELENWIPMLRSGSENAVSKGKKEGKALAEFDFDAKIALLEKTADFEDRFWNSGERRQKNLQVYIVSYSLAARNKQKLTDFDLVICDEAHYLKERDAQRTTAIKEIVSNASKVILLSGTPALSRPIELFSQIDLILTGKRKIPFHKYASRYCVTEAEFHPEETKKEPKKIYNRRGLSAKAQFCMQQKDAYSGHSHLDELRWLMQKTCLIRRTKKEVLEQLLPQKKRTHIVLPISQEKKGENSTRDANASTTQSFTVRSMKDLLTQSSDDVSQEKRLGIPENAEGLSDLRKTETIQLFYETSVMKADAVCAYLSDYLGSCFVRRDDKVVIFAHHSELLNRIEVVINTVRGDPSKGHDAFQYIRIDGTTPITNRADLIQRFQTKESYKVALCSMLAVGVGVNFCSAKTCIFAELYWTPAVLIQAEDRIHRLGQKGSSDDAGIDISKRSIEIQYLIAQGTFDDALWPLIQKKCFVTSSILETSGSKMSYKLRKENRADQVGEN